MFRKRGRELLEKITDIEQILNTREPNLDSVIDLLDRVIDRVNEIKRDFRKRVNFRGDNVPPIMKMDSYVQRYDQIRARQALFKKAPPVPPVPLVPQAPELRPSQAELTRKLAASFTGAPTPQEFLKNSGVRILS